MLEDCDGFIVSDSHAINGYLVDKYGKNDSLFPKDPKVRATINHRLHFDSSVFFVKGVNIVVSIYKRCGQMHTFFGLVTITYKLEAKY